MITLTASVLTVALLLTRSHSNATSRKAGATVIDRTNALRPKHRGSASSKSASGVKPRALNAPSQTASTLRRTPTGGTASGRTTALLASVDGKTVAIDPGHNGGNYQHATEVNKLVNAGTLMKPCDNTGTATDDGFTEAAYNLDVAVRLAEVLKAAGAEVVLTRSTNTGWGPCITARAAIGNHAHADAAISIHADGGPASGRGFHVIYPASITGLTDDIATASYRLAVDIRASFRDRTAMPYSTYAGVAGLDERNDLGGLNLSDVPKVFVETGNMRNATDAALLESPAFREREARALARGLAAFLG